MAEPCLQPGLARSQTAPISPTLINTEIEKLKHELLDFPKSTYSVGEIVDVRRRNGEWTKARVVSVQDSKYRWEYNGIYKLIPFTDAPMLIRKTNESLEFSPGRVGYQLSPERTQLLRSTSVSSHSYSATQPSQQSRRKASLKKKYTMKIDRHSIYKRNPSIVNTLGAQNFQTPSKSPQSLTNTSREVSSDTSKDPVDTSEITVKDNLVNKWKGTVFDPINDDDSTRKGGRRDRVEATILNF